MDDSLNTFTRAWLAALLAVAGGAAVAACGSAVDDDAQIDRSQDLLLGGALPGTNSTAFAAAKANFSLTETAQDGAGPIFNESACSSCHSNAATGGAGENIERRYGAIVNGVFNPLAGTGGSLRQLFGIGGFNPSPGVNCNSGVDVEPASATIRNVGRLTTPLFGLGLVDSLPDSAFDTLASREASSIRGIVNRVTTVLPNPSDGRHSRRPLRLEGGCPEPRAVLRGRIPERNGHHHEQLHRRHSESRLRHREPGESRPDQRRHQRMPRRPGSRH